MVLERESKKNCVVKRKVQYNEAGKRQMNHANRQPPPLDRYTLNKPHLWSPPEIPSFPPSRIILPSSFSIPIPSNLSLSLSFPSPLATPSLHLPVQYLAHLFIYFSYLTVIIIINGPHSSGAEIREAESTVKTTLFVTLMCGWGCGTAGRGTGRRMKKWKKRNEKMGSGELLEIYEHSHLQTE